MPLSIQQTMRFNSEPPQTHAAVPSRLKREVRQMLWDEFRIDADENGRIPQGENQTPRIMIFGPNGLQDANELGILPGSDEFTQQILRGNVLVFPLGEAKPVQLQAGKLDTSSPVFTKSAPLEPEAMLAAPVEEMTAGESAARFFSFGYANREKKRRIAQQKQRNQAAAQKLRSVINSRSAIAAQEKAGEQKLVEDRRKRLAQAALDKDLEAAYSDAMEKADGMDNIVSMFRAEPLIQEQHVGIKEYKEVVKNGKTVTEVNYVKRGIYTEDEFKDLTVFTKDAEKRRLEEEAYQNSLSPAEQKKFKPHKFVEFDQAAIKLGPEGRRLSDEEFASLSMLTCFRPDIAMEEVKRSNDFDPSVRESLRMLGVPEEDLEAVMSYGSRSMGTLDNFMRNGRTNEGVKFGYYSDRGRQETVKALQAYQNGDKKPLAKLIVNGFNTALMSLNTFSSTKGMGYEIAGSAAACSRLLSLTEKDPELMTLALDNGLKPETLNNVKGMIRMDEIDTLSFNAVRGLAGARAEGLQLDRETKKEFARTIVASRLLTQKLYQFGSKQAGNQPGVKKYLDQISFVNDETRNVHSKRYNPNREQWPVLPKGQINQNCTGLTRFGIIAKYAETPKFVSDMADPKSEKSFFKLVDKIVEQEGLADKSVEELYQGLKPSGNYKISDMLQRATAPQNKKNEQEKELQNQNQLQNQLQNQNQNRKQSAVHSQSEPTVNNPAPVAGS